MDDITIYAQTEEKVFDVLEVLLARFEARKVRVTHFAPRPYEGMHCFDKCAAPRNSRRSQGPVDSAARCDSRRTAWKCGIRRGPVW